MKPKVLLLQESVVSYRVPIYEIIAQHVDLTVGYTVKNECKADISFNIIKLNFKKFKSLVIIKSNFFELCKQYEVVIFMPDLHYLSYCLLPFVRRKYKVIPWSIGIRASYTKRYKIDRKKDFLDRIFGKILRKSDATIFYMKAPIQFWGNYINTDKIFIAHNTVEVLIGEKDDKQVRNKILFIGTLYKEKGIYELIDCFVQARKNSAVDDFLILEIIGKGDEYNNIKQIIEDQKLSASILLRGPIYDEKKLAEHFSKSLLCVSPNQAGLSVLKSMGYGVPYITRVNAITGGERLNIINGENGLLYSTKEELVSIIRDAYETPKSYIRMGVKAKSYYMNTATPKHMAQGVLDAISFVLGK